MVGVGYMRDGTSISPKPPPSTTLLRRLLFVFLSATVARFPAFTLSLSDLIKRWPASPARHEILVISDGIDYSGGPAQ